MKKTDKHMLEELADNIEMLRRNVDLLTAHVFLDENEGGTEDTQPREHLYHVTIERTRTIRDTITVPVMLTAEEVHKGGDAMAAATVAAVEDRDLERDYELLSLAEDIEVVDAKWKP